MQDQDGNKPRLGRFWLPGQGEEAAIPGVIEFNEEGAAVQLQGALTPTGLLADSVVFAQLQGRPEKATLFNCFASAQKTAEGSVVASELKSTLVALGSMRKDLGGHSIQFCLPGSQTWFHEQAFDIAEKDGSDFVIRFKAYESTHYHLTVDLTLDRIYSAMVPMGNWGVEALEINRPMSFRISSTTRLNFDHLWEMMYRLRRFLEFLSQQHFPHTHLRIYDDADTNGPVGIEIRHALVHAVIPKKFEWDGQLVRYDVISDRFPELLGRWFDIHCANPEPFARYFAAFDHKRMDIILHFLWNIAALEELHKLRTTRVTGQKFYLLDRLKDIRERWSVAFDVLPQDDVLKRIKNSRDYYAHAAGDLRDHAAKDWELLRFGDFVSALSNLEILALLGLNDEEVIRCAKRYWMREALALRTYPNDAGGT